MQAGSLRLRFGFLSGRGWLIAHRRLFGALEVEGKAGIGVHLAQVVHLLSGNVIVDVVGVVDVEVT